ncbi:MAG TPA: 50S ribosomal protein L20 [Candidatus Saccharimonadales bacterium]|nr:50S ribosomal protein L20 [Candidatus Saccharimonadales bacterium]
MRVKRGVAARAKHKKVLKLAKGMQHNRTRSFRLAKQAVIRALQYAYRDRRNRKRDLRSLWITRINAAARENGTTYGKLIAGLKGANIELDRKVLAELAVNEPKAFAEIVKSAKA